MSDMYAWVYCVAEPKPGWYKPVPNSECCSFALMETWLMSSSTVALTSDASIVGWPEVVLSEAHDLRLNRNTKRAARRSRRKRGDIPG